MLQRDYISRLIREFMAALQRYLEKNEAGARRKTCSASISARMSFITRHLRTR